MCERLFSFFEQPLENAMKSLMSLVAVLALTLSVSACNTWSGVKEDAKGVGQAAGSGIEKAGEKIKEVSK
jgi:predicted small secreted protein